MINLLVISDSPSMNSGLARITRDLVSRLYVDFGSYDNNPDGRKPILNITQMGLNWNNGLSKDKFRRYEFPWNVVNMEDTEEWGANDLAKMVLDATLDGTAKPDLIFTVYDPGRMTGVAKMAKLFGIPLWGYFPIDSYNVHEAISGPALEALESYSRVLAYGPFGLSVLKNSGSGLNIEGSLPHGLDEEWFKEADLKPLYEMRVPVEFLKADYIIGAVATNQPRKDLGLLFQAVSILKAKRPGDKIHLWLHTDMQHGYWSIPQLALDFGFSDDLLVTDAEYSDEEMRALYGMCDVTVGPGAGEGFGYPLCFKPGVWVETKFGAKKIEDMQIGDLVLTHTGSYKPVTNVLRRNVNEDLIVIEPFYAGSVSATKEHPFLVSEKGWVDAALVTIQDRLIIPKPSIFSEDITDLDLALECSRIECDDEYIWRKSGYSGKTGQLVKANRYIKLNQEFCRFLGLYLAEGHTADNGLFSFAFHQKEIEYIEFVSGYIFNTLGLTPTRRLKKTYPCVEVWGSFSAIGEWLQDICGKGARNKKIPEFVFQLPGEKILALLKGLFQGDGTGKGTGLNLTSSSQKLIEDVRILLKILGFVSTVRHTTRQWKGQPRNESTLDLHGDSGRDLAEQFNMVYKDQRSSTRISPPKYIESFYNFTIPIRKIETEKYIGPVFNLSVLDDESYCVNGVVVHNCESLATGRPVVHGAFGGGADLVPARWQPEPFGEHLTGSYALVRPIYDPYFYADYIESAMLEDSNFIGEYCKGVVANLNWHYLWPRWRGWFNNGFKQFSGK